MDWFCIANLKQKISVTNFGMFESTLVTKWFNDLFRNAFGIAHTTQTTLQDFQFWMENSPVRQSSQDTPTNIMQISFTSY